MNPFRAWNVFWFGPISARPLGAFRIAFGVVLLANLAFLAFYIDYVFTDSGLLRGVEASEIAGPMRPSILLWIPRPARSPSLLRSDGESSLSCSPSAGTRGSWPYYFMS